MFNPKQLSKELIKEAKYDNDTESDDSMLDNVVRQVEKSKVSKEKKEAISVLNDQDSSDEEVVISRDSKVKKATAPTKPKKVARFVSDHIKNFSLLLKYNNIEIDENKKYSMTKPFKINSLTTCIKVDRNLDLSNLSNYSLLITNKHEEVKEGVKVVDISSAAFFNRYYNKLLIPDAKIDFLSLEYLIVLILCANSITIDCNHPTIVYMISRILKRFDKRAEGMVEMEYLEDINLLESNRFIKFLSKNQMTKSFKDELLLEIYKTQSFLLPLEYEAFDGFTKILLKRKEFFFNELTRLIEREYPLILEEHAFKRYVYVIENMRQGTQIPLFEVEDNKPEITNKTLIRVNEDILQKIKDMSLIVEKKYSTTWFTYLPLNAFYQNDPVALSYNKVVTACKERQDLSDMKDYSLSLHLKKIKNCFLKQGNGFKISLDNERKLKCLPPLMSFKKYVKLLKDKKISFVIDKDNKIKINSDDKAISTLIKFGPDSDNKYVHPPYISQILDNNTMSRKDINSNEALIDYIIQGMHMFTRLLTSHLLSGEELVKFLKKEDPYGKKVFNYVASNRGECKIEYGIKIDVESSAFKKSPILTVRNALQEKLHLINSEPISEPANEPISEPANEPISEPANEPLKEIANEPAKEPAKETVSEPISEPAKETYVNKKEDEDQSSDEDL